MMKFMLVVHAQGGKQSGVEKSVPKNKGRILPGDNRPAPRPGESNADYIRRAGTVMGKTAKTRGKLKRVIDRVRGRNG